MKAFPALGMQDHQWTPLQIKAPSTKEKNPETIKRTILKMNGEEKIDAAMS